MAITLDGSDNKIAIGANATGSAYVRLYEDTDNGTNYVDIIAPASITSNRTLTLPDSTGTILTGSSAIAASQLPAGSVLQVVSANSTTYATSSSSTFSDAGLSASITPTSASSKVLVLCSLNGLGKGNNTNTDAGANYRLVDGSNNVLASLGNGLGWNSSTTYNITCSLSTSYLHSPNTTSSFTYKIQFASYNSRTNGATINWYNDSSDTRSFITLMEIAA